MVPHCRAQLVEAGAALDARKIGRRPSLAATANSVALTTSFLRIYVPSRDQRPVRREGQRRLLGRRLRRGRCKPEKECPPHEGRWGAAMCPRTHSRGLLWVDAQRSTIPVGRSSRPTRGLRVTATPASAAMSEKSVPARVRDRLEAAMYPQLPEDVLDVIPDGRWTHTQPLSGGRRVQYERHEAEQLELATRERGPRPRNRIRTGREY